MGARAGAGGASRISGRKSASAIRATACSWVTRAEGAVHISLGETIRKNKWGRDRKYVVAFLSGGSPQRPLAEFVAADDYEETRDLVAVIRGSDGGRRMYSAGDALPGLYGRLSDSAFQRAGRLSGRLEQGRRRRARDEDATMLNRAIQAGAATRRRQNIGGLLRRSVRRCLMDRPSRSAPGSVAVAGRAPMPVETQCRGVVA